MQKQFRKYTIASKDFKTTLQAIAYNIGIREELDLHDLDSIFRYLSKYFGGLSLTSIVEAFDLYSCQQLEFKGGHFNSFDRVFIGRVLKSYEKYKSAQYVKPKLVGGVVQRHESTFQEKKIHFEWLLNSVFLEDSKRTGKAGEFPRTLICNWKDCFDYMISEGMLKEKEGQELIKRLEEVKNLSILEDKSKTKSLSASIKIKINGGGKPMSYYRFEVMDWFKANKEQLTF